MGGGALTGFPRSKWLTGFGSEGGGWPKNRKSNIAESAKKFGFLSHRENRRWPIASGREVRG